MHHENARLGGEWTGFYGYSADLSRSWTIGHTRMTICVESYIGEPGAAHDAVKLESQVLITGAGFERLDSFPFEGH